MSGSSSYKTAGNPLAVDPEREHRVRERAYHLWEAEGKPHGRDVEFWERARELIAIEDSGGAEQLPKPRARPKSARKTGVEEAEIQGNLSELSDGLAYQGEVKPAHAPKRKARARKKPE